MAGEEARLVRDVGRVRVPMSRETRVAVCVITYKRPEGLKRLLDGLAALTFQETAAPSLLKIVVADNDPAGSARAVCEDILPDYPWPLAYRIEPRRGIPYARNASVALARDAPAADFMAFVDDDEVPEPSWLGELLRVQRLHGADVVAGPAVAHLDGQAPGWVERGGFFRRARFPTGFSPEPVYVATNNVLVRSGVLEKVGEANGGKVFDERYAMSGGSDTNLFMRVDRAGYKVVWADGAVVRDRIPASRANARWLLQRSYRFGNTHALCERDLEPSIAARALRVAKAAKQILQGLVLVPPSVLLGRHALVGALRWVCRGAGMLTGVLGIRYQEYRKKTHGT